jgi:hypothetical protein
MDQPGNQSASANADAQRRSRPSYGWLPLALCLALTVALPLALIWLGFWSSSETWDFEGRGLRYAFFISGTRLERLGFVGASGKPERYSVSLPEGTFPGWRIVSYDSNLAPLAIMEAYGERCRTMGLKVIKGPVAETRGEVESARLVCEIEFGLDVDVLAKRRPGSPVSEVDMRVWGWD